ncbi:MAG TPA: ribosome maturation factor RimP [Nitrospinota bacterium]|nr:ribosome maturation factor RimP [Nitrospinota bacterium]
MSVSSEKLSINEKIQRLVRPIVEAEEMELVDVEYKKGSNSVLRIFIDKPEGVNVSDCTKISTQVGAFLDIEDLIENNYVLEVSSPGLDRPLKNKADYDRNKGKLIKVSLYAPLEGKKTFIGRIISADDQKVILKEKSDKVIDIPFAAIAKGKLKIEF